MRPTDEHHAPMPAEEHEPEDRPALPHPVREHLARQLRATYNLQVGKPDYLGDPALPPEFDPQVRRLERRLKAQEAGTEAVEAALRGLSPGGTNRTAD